MKFIDLFCGCGGFTEGMKQAGHIPVLGIDLEEIALESYEANHRCKVWNKNVMDIEFDILPEADFIIGSPPCQEFSEINQNGKGRGEGANTKYLDKFLEIGASYNYMIGENVEAIRKVLPNGMHNQLLNANGFGLYHKRTRCFFGVFSKVKPQTKMKYVFPTPVAMNRLGRGGFYTQTSLSQRKDFADIRLSYPVCVSKWIMGFPDDYIVLGSKREQEKQIGNAVCPPVAKAIGETLNEK